MFPRLLATFENFNGSKTLLANYKVSLSQFHRCYLKIWGKEHFLTHSSIRSGSMSNFCIVPQSPNSHGVTGRGSNTTCMFRLTQWTVSQERNPKTRDPKSFKMSIKCASPFFKEWGRIFIILTISMPVFTWRGDNLSLFWGNKQIYLLPWKETFSPPSKTFHYPNSFEKIV